MEGDLKVSPGQQVDVGYSFTIPGNNRPWQVSVTSQTAPLFGPTVTFTIRCVSGATPSDSAWNVNMPPVPESNPILVTGSGWYPSGDQKSPLVWQGSGTMPNFCNGGQVRLDKGGTFRGVFQVFPG